MKNKDKLRGNLWYVNQICKRHPSYNNYAPFKMYDIGYYTGGMCDTGDWYKLKMLRMKLSTLKMLYEYILDDEKPEQERIYTQDEIIKMNTIIDLGNGFKINKLQEDALLRFYEYRNKNILYGK